MCLYAHSPRGKKRLTLGTGLPPVRFSCTCAERNEEHSQISMTDQKFDSISRWAERTQIRSR